jgi:ABC-type Fe3+-siderophore transport system permease subunit
MEELRVTNLLGGALAAISGAVVASFLGVFGTLAGAGVMSIFMAVATAGYAHSLAATHRWLRRTLVRRVGDDAEADTPPAQPIRWQRVALAAAVIFALAIGAVTTVEAVARRPLASLLGSQPPPGASTSVGVVVGQSAARAPRAPNTSATSPPASASTTTAPAGVVTTTAPAGTVPSTTAPSTTAPLTPSTYAPTTQRR